MTWRFIRKHSSATFVRLLLKCTFNKQHSSAPINWRWFRIKLWRGRRRCVLFKQTVIFWRVSFAAFIQKRTLRKYYTIALWTWTLPPFRTSNDCTFKWIRFCQQLWADEHFQPMCSRTVSECRTQCATSCARVKFQQFGAKVKGSLDQRAEIFPAFGERAQSMQVNAFVTPYCATKQEEHTQVQQQHGQKEHS